MTTYMYESLMTLLFFLIGQTDYLQTFDTSFFRWSCYFPLQHDSCQSKKIDSQNPQEAAMVIRIQTHLRSLVRRNQLDFYKSSLRNYLIDDNFLNTALDLKIFSPGEPLGILILF